VCASPINPIPAPIVGVVAKLSGRGHSLSFAAVSAIIDRALFGLKHKFAAAANLCFKSQNCTLKHIFAALKAKDCHKAALMVKKTAHLGLL
jgi:hypothetical protein